MSAALQRLLDAAVARGDTRLAAQLEALLQLANNPAADPLAAVAEIVAGVAIDERLALIEESRLAELRAKARL